MKVNKPFKTRDEAKAWLESTGWLTGSIGETFRKWDMPTYRRTIEFNGVRWIIHTERTPFSTVKLATRTP